MGISASVGILSVQPFHNTLIIKYVQWLYALINLLSRKIHHLIAAASSARDTAETAEYDRPDTPNCRRILCERLGRDGHKNFAIQKQLF